MDKLLEEAKKYLDSTYTDSNYEISLCEHIGIPRKLLEHLIQQAEIVKKLEDEVASLEMTLEVATSEKEEMEQTLEFYGQRSNYLSGEDYEDVPKVNLDAGERARKQLEREDDG